MQHPHPDPEFPLQPQSLHPHAHDLRQWEMGTDYLGHPSSSQPPDRSVNGSATQNPYSLPMVMDPRFLANPANALSQHYPSYIGPTPSGLLTGIAHHPAMGFAQGNSYINVSIESPTRPKQTKKRKQDGGTATSRKHKGMYNLLHKEAY